MKRCVWNVNSKSMKLNHISMAGVSTYVQNVMQLAAGSQIEILSGYGVRNMSVR